MKRTVIFWSLFWKLFGGAAVLALLVGITRGIEQHSGAVVYLWIQRIIAVGLGIIGTVGVIGISPPGIDYDTEELVHCIFLVLMGDEHRGEHLSLLSSIVTLLTSPGLSKMRAAKCAEDVHDVLCRFDQAHGAGQGPVT
jgi:hypothetical protein